MSLIGRDTERLGRHPLLAQADTDTLAMLCRSALVQTFPEETTLVAQGEPVDYLYILMDGEVAVSGTWKDREATLTVLRPNATFILPAVVLDADALTSARTVHRSRLAMLPAEQIRQAFANDPAFARAVAHALSADYRGLVRGTKSQKLRVGAERLANYLFAEQARQGGAPTFELSHKKGTIAGLLNMSAENLSRAFATLAGYGVIVNGPQITIRPNAKLNRLARPDRLIDEAVAPCSAESSAQNRPAA